MVPVLLLLLIPVALGADYENGYIKLKSHLKKMRAELTWEVGLNPRLRGMSDEQLRQLAGANLQDISNLPEATPSFTGSLPREFDARDKWSNCKSIRLIRDQSQCGSCWAVSSAAVMSDRQCIASGGRKQPYVSDVYLLSCCTRCGHGCNGGWMAPAFQFHKRGIPTGGIYGSKKGCQPYTIPPNARHSYSTPPCRKNYCIPEYRAGAYQLRNEQKAMQDIYSQGPITAAFTLYQDFYYYRSGVYQHQSGGSYGGHAIRIIGWGEENGTPYWLIANSWNKSWGMEGLFKIRRGVNECGIENYMITGKAKVQ